MNVKQSNVRIEEGLYGHVNRIAGNEGVSISEIVRNALRLYVLIYERTKEKDARVILESDGTGKDRIELVLPWLL